MAFLNLVDPITHDLLVNLARDLQCPKKVSSADTGSKDLCSHTGWVALGEPLSLFKNTVKNRCELSC